MAKLLKKTPPKSSMSRLLNEEAIATALGDNEEEELSAPAAAPMALRIVEAASPAPERVEVEAPVQAPAKTLQNVAALRPSAKSSLIRGGELYLTERSDQILRELVGTFKTNTNKAVASTHVLRGILLALQPYLSQIKRESAALGPLKRPANESQFALEREEFERAIGDVVMRAVRG